jgi:predicted adenine nucleotide alpha hydrolase (AANH) superfamily ATPase
MLRCYGGRDERLGSSGRSCRLLYTNIHPRKEYEIRKEENKRYCERIGVPFIDCDYDVHEWYERMKGMEYDPERGHRCTECFDMRMERAAFYAHENGFDGIATTNATSRWKDVQQVDDSGHRALEYDGVKYWAYDWQSGEILQSIRLRGSKFISRILRLLLLCVIRTIGIRQAEIQGGETVAVRRLLPICG